MAAPMKKRVAKQISMRDSIRSRGMWAGSKNPQDIETYVLEEVKSETKSEQKIEERFVLDTLKYPPALMKIIDEIIVNALDHHVTYPKLVTQIKITLDDSGLITVFNNGPGIPIEETKNLNGVKMYTPQLIFSEYLAGSNLDDEVDDERIVGGQNGLGAKITSVFSTTFTVETCDEKQIYKQEFADGLNIIHPPEIKKSKLKSYTKITFMPDYAEFKINIKTFYPTLYKIMQARAWQAAAYVAAKVSFNDLPITIKSFQQFAEMFTEFDVYSTTMTTPDNKFPWEVCIGITDGKERQIGIVNSILISKGGTHIKHIQNHLVENLKDRIEKELKKSGTKFSKNLLLNNLFIFMKGAIPNPEFSSQTKVTLETPISKFAEYSIPEKEWNRIWDFVKPAVMSSFLKKQLGPVKTRANRGKVDVPKYTEAKFCRDAKKCHQCGLIITEGDSASGTADLGLQSKIAHLTSPTFTYEYFGVYGIQGVMMNGLKESMELDKKKKKPAKAAKPAKTAKGKKDDAEEFEESKEESKEELSGDIVNMATGKLIPNEKVLNNERISSLVKVLGLDYNKSYDFTEQGEKEWKTLRYGFIAGLTDQDLDGFNIFGLLATFFMTYWPNLIKRNFIRRIYTPLVRAYPKKKGGSVKEFYTENQASAWLEEIGSEAKNYTFQYYKGLGTHDEELGEVSSMFSNINKKICTYVLDEEAIKQMYIFYGPETLHRKKALAGPVNIDPVESLLIPLSQQYKIDTKLYQRDNIIRKLLSAIDGFVCSRRKVFYAARKVGNVEMKVAGLAGQVVSRANYHHGEDSLEKTIVRMAQFYPGARNLPLLRPKGNYGTRKMGYKNFAASRYIKTIINHRLADKLFRKEDEFILEYEIEDGERFEPKYYVPIIPYVLCENNDMPSTGWKITTYARDIDAIFKNTRDMINGVITNCGKLPIWKRDYYGDIRKYTDSKKKTKEYFVGDYEYDAKNNTVTIKELPFGKYSDAYLKGPEDCKKSERKRGILAKEWIEDADDNTTLDGVNIVLYLKEGAYDEINKHYGNKTFDAFEEYLELKERIDDHINLVNEKEEVVEYKKYEDVFDTWFQFRKNLYVSRVDREIILNDLEIVMLKNMQRFSKEHDGYGITNKTKESEASDILKENKYALINKTTLDNPKFTEIKDLANSITKHGASYDYLLNLSYRDLTEEAYEKRNKKIKEIEDRQVYLKDDGGMFKGAKIWLKELDELEHVISEGMRTKWSYGENKYKFDTSNGIE
jgi:DNA topoisomerase-2